MKFGVNTFVWVSPCTTSDVAELAPKVKNLGFEILEISCENPTLLDVGQVKQDLEKNGLMPIVCGAFGPDRNLCSSDPQLVENARVYIRWLNRGCTRARFASGLRTDVFGGGQRAFRR